ncbi:MAG: hypothetical protein JSS70_08130 [Bacteroidetes bacterium]|nr:hypothetical protein [Bacteroidota bacterium]
MNRLLFMLTLAFTTNCFGQKQEKFNVSEIISNDSFAVLNKNQFKVNSENIFEDSTYVVSKTCSGEWGGTIKFKNKKTGVTVSAASTCPVVVNKLDGKYFVTNTLAHLSGFSDIIEIRNPDDMSVFELPKPRKKKGKIIMRYVGDDEAKSTKGTKSLVDSIGVLTLATFPYRGQLFHVVTDFRKTYLTQVVDGKFVSIDTVSNESLWTYDPEVFITPDKHSIVFFDNEKVSGYLDIFENTIKVRRRK